MRFFTTLLFTILLTGCGQVIDCNVPTVTADFRYSKAGGFGFQNAGFHTLGEMFVWNISNNALHPIGVAELNLAPSANTFPGFQDSAGVSGLRLAGIPNTLLGKARLLAAEKRQQTKFTIEGATKEGTQNVRPAFVKYVTDIKADGNDPDVVLRPRNDNYWIVTINSVLHTKTA